MDIDNVTMITRTALYTIIKCASPLLLVSLVVGLAISIFQTVTSIQEQTLTFVPKVLGIFAAIMILGHWILNEIVTYTVELWNGFSLYIR
ncbi:MAG: flagellar biosynthesis protein FliQ [Lachnospiraceae bacterium]|nr:flagellar biosynthesis protein FliQ [Lachnospiraceae bacterium]